MYILTYIHTVKLRIYIHTYTYSTFTIHIRNNNKKNRLDADLVNRILYNTCSRTTYMQRNLSASGRVPSTEDMLPIWMATESLWSR